MSDPGVTEATVAQRTAEAFAYMRDVAPDYFFAYMPWLLVNAAAGGSANAWENDAWFPLDGTPRPVVDAVKALAGTQPAPVQPPVVPANTQYADVPSTPEAAQFSTAATNAADITPCTRRRCSAADPSARPHAE